MYGFGSRSRHNDQIAKCSEGLNVQLHENLRRVQLIRMLEKGT